MGTVAAVARIAEVAEAQQGLITARQAEARGVPHRDLARLASGGGLLRVAYGVYRVVGAPRPEFLELRAAWLQLAPDTAVDTRRPAQGVVSHASAATVHQVGFLEPVRHEFTVPPPRRQRSRRADVSIHRAALAEDDVQWAEEMLVTTPLRTVADLCAQTVDGGHLAGVVAGLLDRRLADRAEVERALAPYSFHYGGTPFAGDEFLDYLMALVDTAQP
jgi:predicted transcriptional regulator of viral defense system